MAEDPLATVLVLVPSFILVSLVFSLIIGMRRFKKYRPLFTILISPGIIMHEVSHYLMCKVLRINTEKVRLLEVDQYWNIGGYVCTEPIQNSFFKPFLVAIAPSLINTILTCLLILSYPYVTEAWMKLLISWLAVSFVLSCRPSLSDLAIAFKSIVKYPRHSLREFEYLAVGIVGGLILYRTTPIVIGLELPLLLVAGFSVITTVLAYALLREK